MPISYVQLYADLLPLYDLLGLVGVLPSLMRISLVKKGLIATFLGMGRWEGKYGGRTN